MVLVIPALEVLFVHLVRIAVGGDLDVRASLRIGSNLDALALPRLATETILALGLGHHFGAIRGIGVALDGDFADGFDGACRAGGLIAMTS